MLSMQAPHKILVAVNTFPTGSCFQKTYIMVGRKMDGRHFFRRKFARASKTAYPTKKIVSVALKRCSDIGMSVVR